MLVEITIMGCKSAKHGNMRLKELIVERSACEPWNRMKKLHSNFKQKDTMDSGPWRLVSWATVAL